MLVKGKNRGPGPGCSEMIGIGVRWWGWTGGRPRGRFGFVRQFWPARPADPPPARAKPCRPRNTYGNDRSGKNRRPRRRPPEADAAATSTPDPVGGGREVVAS